jgi:DNA-binding LytR/AlgR family response regulator
MTPDPHRPRPTALLADDEPHLLRHLERMLADRWPDLVIEHRARHGVEAARMLSESPTDVAFLDIRMPGLTGLEVAQGIDGPTQVVFVTAFEDHAVQAFDQNAVDYLLKPVTAERLARAVDRVRKALAARDASGAAGPALDGSLARALQALIGPPASPPASHLRWIRASQGDLTTLIDVDDVLCFHADDKYTVVRTAMAEHLIRTPIVELVSQLDPEVFWQIHRSTIVNVRSVSGTRRDEQSRLFVQIRGLGGEWPVSRAYVHRFKAM